MRQLGPLCQPLPHLKNQLGFFGPGQIQDRPYTYKSGQIVLNIRLNPGACGVNRITGLYHDDKGCYVSISVIKPAVNEETNQELVMFFAKKLGLPKSGISLGRGHHSRFKQVKIDGKVDKKKIKELYIDF